MKSILEYKGYHTKIEVDLEAGILFGKIEGIRDLVNFESESIENIENEFHQAVDDYLQFCNEVGKVPEKEYKGTFNVRISPELHRKVAFLAFKNNESLNQTVEKAIQMYVEGTSQTEITLQETISKLSNAISLNPTSFSITENNLSQMYQTFPAEQNFKMFYKS